MSKSKKQKSRLKNHLINPLRGTGSPPEVTRREFVQYSTFALVAAALPISWSGCNPDEPNNIESKALTLDQTSIEPGQTLGIQSDYSPGDSELPEDIYSVAVRVDETVTYGLRPIYFSEGWIGVVIPPMVKGDGIYFDQKELEVSLMVSGESQGNATITINQDLSVTDGGEKLFSLLNEIETELTSIEDEKETLFEDVVLLEKWDSMYPAMQEGLAWLSAMISSVNEGVESEVVTIGGDTYSVTPQDVAMAELMITNLTNSPADLQNGETMANVFWDSMPEPGSAVIEKLTALLAYLIPAAFVVMTKGGENVSDTPSGTGTIAAILTIAVPAACLCVAGNCLRVMASSEMEEEWINNGLNWYANVLMNQGLYAVNEHMICDFAVDNDQIIKLLPQNSFELLEDISGSFWSDVPWSNSTPWSNGTPWSNNTTWSNNIWTNQPWSHTPWNNTVLWDNNPWSNNVWNNTTPWSNNAWSNITPWSDNAWSNTPWGNTPWGNTPWGNTPWGNTPWGNTPWGNFVNSGIQRT